MRRRAAATGPARAAERGPAPRPPGPATGYRWAVLAAATLAQATSSFAMQGLGALAGFLQEAFGLTGTTVGLLVTVAGAAPVVALLIVGHLLDRHDERAIVGAGAVVVACGLTLAALADRYALVLAGLFVLGIGYSTAQPGGSKSVAAWFPGRNRGLAMGIRQAGLPLGGAAAALAMPAVAHARGWQAAFAVAAAVSLAGGAVFVAVHHRPQGQDAPAPARPLWPRLTEQLRRPAMPGIVVSGTVLVTAQYGITTYLMLYLRDHHGIPLTRGAFVLFGVQGIGAAGRIALAAASDRLGTGRLPWIRASMLATAAALLALPLLPPGPGPVIALTACLGFFGFGWYGPWVAHVSESCPPDRVGLALGTAMAANQIAIVTTPPLLGLAHDLLGYPAMWWILATVVAASTPLVRKGVR
ncbi:MFS transporter [Streptomyces sp. NPDC046261]|uniref:MFS transporter n=1 Tax=Streptomyces sp. NPDC046261 TaxID=3157200 RepID=UPI0033DD284E